MKRLILIMLAVCLLTVPCFAAEYREDEYVTGEDKAYWDPDERNEVIEYWTDKLEAMTADNVYFFKYEPIGIGAMSQIAENYGKTKSIMSSAVSVTAPEIVETVHYKKTVENTEWAEWKEWVVSTVVSEVKGNVLSDIEYILNNNSVLDNFDYLSEELEFSLLLHDPYGEFLVISDGEKEIFMLDHWAGTIVEEKKLYSPGQFLAVLLYDADWMEDEKYYDYTKEVPSTGGSDAVNLAVLAAGVSVLGAVAGAVFSRKKGSSK